VKYQFYVKIYVKHKS